VVHNIQIQFGPVQGLCCLSVTLKRLFNFFRLTEVKKTDVTILGRAIRLGLVVHKNLCRQYAEGEVRIRLNRPLELFGFLLFSVVRFHLLHLFSNKLIVLFRVALRHVIKHLPVALHLLLCLRVSFAKCLHHSLHTSELGLR